MFCFDCRADQKKKKRLQEGKLRKVEGGVGGLQRKSFARWRAR